MFYKFAIFFWIVVIYVLIQACISPSEGKTQISNFHESKQSDSQKDFPLLLGTTWVYSHTAYESKTDKLTNAVTSTFVITETVVYTQIISPYFAAKIDREEQQIASSPNSSIKQTGTPSEFWYVISGTQIYEAYEPLNLTNFLDSTSTRLVYSLPLSPEKTWCTFQPEVMPKRINCETAGKRTVIRQISYNIAAENFKNCFEINELFTSGGIISSFCLGIGTVAEKYNHGGSRFGFHKTLIFYSIP